MLVGPYEINYSKNILDISGHEKNLASRFGTSTLLQSID